MKNVSKIGLYGFAVGLSALFIGCASEKVMVDYVMPAKAVADVSKVNVVSIRVKSNVTGNLAGDGGRNAGLVRQLLATRLYKEGFYQVADDIWSNADGALALQQQILEKDSGHGYATFGAMGQGREKAVIDLELDFSLDANPVKKEIPFVLTTVPYKLDPKKPGVSYPDPKKATEERVSKMVTVYEVVAKGTLRAKFSGVNGTEAPVAYENTFAVEMPEADRFGSAKPSQLKALAAAVSSAIDGVVADISPYRETRAFEPISGGDKRVTKLLCAKAFPEVVTVVEQLALNGKGTAPDFENLGIAFEAMGELNRARGAYGLAVKANPESLTAKAGSKRVAEMLAGKKTVKKSGAEKNRDIQFAK